MNLIHSQSATRNVAIRAARCHRMPRFGACDQQSLETKGAFPVYIAAYLLGGTEESNQWLLQALPAGGHGEPTRRDFLMVATGALGAVGAAAVAWPFINNLNPAADTLALSTDRGERARRSQVGQAITVKWRGKPVFIRHRTPKPRSRRPRPCRCRELPDPQTDDARVTDTAKKVRRSG